MNANHLRIGNLVDTINREQNVHMPSGIPLKIFSIQPFKISAYGVLDNAATLRNIPEYELKDVCPIQLTEEWLINFGFKKSRYFGGKIFLIETKKGEYFELSKGDNWKAYEYSVVGRNEDGINEFTVEVHFVHQLQNLFFALTTKEIDLTHPETPSYKSS